MLGDGEDAQDSPAADPVRENTTPIVSDPVSPKSMPIQQDVRETGLRRDGKESAVVSVESDSTLGTEDAFVENAEGDSIAAVVDGADVRAATVADTGLRDIPVKDDWLVLQIEAVDSTWVQVRWDESGLFDAIVPPGRTYSWKARDFLPCTRVRHTVCATLFRERSGAEAWEIRTAFCVFSPMQKESSCSALILNRYHPVSSHESLLRGGCSAAPAARQFTYGIPEEMDGLLPGALVRRCPSRSVC